jgi:TonB family protein
MEILSDTGGVDFRPYMRRLHVTIEDHWYPLIPPSALPPTMKSGVVTLELSILKNGDLRELRVAQSSGDAEFDRAAWGAISTSAPLPVLPAEYSSESLRLRCKFFYNPSKTTKAAMPERQRQIYEQGLAEIRAENWGNAEQLLQQAVEWDSSLDLAWNNLGRARMYLHKFAEAEAAFRKFLSLKPADSLPYAQLAWALASEKKYADAAELLEKRVAAVPGDGDAHRRLGIVYLRLHRPEAAVREFENAWHLLPNNESVNYDLGLAYLQLSRNDEAAAAFERSIAIKRTAGKLNDAAYELSKFKTHLGLAETWANSAVGEVETELNQVTLQTSQTDTTTLLRKLSMYWDTLGWIKFQKEDLSTAENYVRAAWELADDTTIGNHLARVYEGKGRKSDAAEAYAQTLAAVPSGAALSDDEKEAHDRLAALLGGEVLVDARVNESRRRFKDRRSVQIDNSAGAEGITEYKVMVGPGSKLTDLQATNSDSRFDKLSPVIRAAAMPQSFPDGGILQLPRAGILACAGSDRPCQFMLLSAGSSARSFSSSPSTSSTEP